MVRNKEFKESDYKPEDDPNNPEFDAPFKIYYECQGIGRGAVCGAEATEQVRAYKWSPEAEKIEKTTIWICKKHSIELCQIQK